MAVKTLRRVIQVPGEPLHKDPEQKGSQLPDCPLEGADAPTVTTVSAAEDICMHLCLTKDAQMC